MPLSHYMGINWFLTSINLWSHNTPCDIYLLQCTAWLEGNTLQHTSAVWFDESLDLVLRVIPLFLDSTHCASAILCQQYGLLMTKKFLHCQWVHIWSLFKSDSVEWKIQGWIIGSCLVPPSAQKIFLRLHLCIVASMINLNFSFVASDNRSMVVHKQKSFNRRNSTKEMWEVPVSGTSSGFRSMTRCSIISRIWSKLLWIKLIPPQRGESHSGER